MDLLRDYGATVIFAFAGLLGGQALRQSTNPGKAVPAVALTLAFIGAAAAIAWYLDPRKTPLDFGAWGVALAIGLILGFRQR